MRDLDEKDLEILRLLSTDARRPYRELADHVDLSPPAVSDRVDRLQQQGVIRNFTLDIDRTKLQSRVPVMIELQASPEAVDTVFETVDELDSTEHVFRLSDGTILCHANAPDNDVHSWLHDNIHLGQIDSYEINHVAEYDWNVNIGPSDFAIPCAVCDNLVRSDGVTAEIGGDIKSFCCPSCKSHYQQKYESLRENR